MAFQDLHFSEILLNLGTVLIQPSSHVVKNFSLLALCLMFLDFGTVFPARDFNAEALCNRLRKSMKGLGTDEKVIIEILSRCDNHQRQELKHKFQSMFGRDLCSDLKSELGGNFEDVVLAMMMPPLDYIVFWLHRAMKGIGTDEYTLIELLCGRPNHEIKAVKEAYKKAHGEDLDEKFKDELSGDFLYLMRSSLTAARDEIPQVDYERAQRDAQELYEAGVGKNFGTDEAKFITVMNMRSYNQLRETFSAYFRFSGHTIEEDIKKELSGPFEAGMLAIVRMVQDPPTYFAERINQSIKGAGTDDDTLIRIVVSRSEIDLGDIKNRYHQLFGVHLGEAIESETKGDYRRMLMALVDPQ